LALKASPAGPLNGLGAYEIDDGVNYGGNYSQVLGRQVIYGYHGENYQGGGQAAQNMHFYDDGLFVGQFGEAYNGHAPEEGALPGYAGNGYFSSFTVTTNEDYYLWVNDESGHGLQRWHFVNARNIRELVGSGNLGSAITLTNPVCAFPTGVTGKSGDRVVELSWLPVPAASAYNLRYSLINGGPYNTLAGTSTNLHYFIGGLTNGQTYYFSVTAVLAGREGIPSEQVRLNPFDAAQTVLCSGSLAEGRDYTSVLDVRSSAPALGQPSYVGAEQKAGTFNLRELDDYGFGNLENEIVGTKGYVIYDWGGYGSQLANVLAPFTVSLGSGWSDINYLEREFSVDDALGTDDGLMANPIGSVSIEASDTNYHYLTVISPSMFVNPRQFTLRLVSTNNTSAAYVVSENHGYSHVFQFKFKGNVTLWADATDGTDAIVQVLLLDDAPVTCPGNPSLDGVSLSGTDLILAGSNGVSGETCYVLMSPSMQAPLIQWRPVATNLLSTSGNFSITVTNTVDAQTPQRFYLLKAQ